MNRQIFFEYVRAAPFGGRLTSGQVDGLTRILDEWEARKLTDDRKLAYMLATTFWETDQTMQPIREKGGEKYLKTKRYYPWVGEGLVQVTWETNHRKFGATKPGQLMTWPIALKALFDGSINGMFTGKKLSDYFNETTDDPVNARRIINGTDKAKLIAKFHENFLDSIKAAKAESAKENKTEKVLTEDVKVSEDASSLGTILSGLGGLGGLGFLSSIDSPYALAAFGLVVLSAAAIGYAYLSGKLVIKRT